VSARREEACWWLAPEGAAARVVEAHSKALMDAYGRRRRRRMNLFRSVYLNEYCEDEGLRYGLSKYPVTTGGVDSLLAKLALSRPRPKILPGSRRFAAKRRAKQLQRWIDGLFKQNGTDQLQDDQLLDSEIYGTGALKVVAKHGKVCHERRHPANLLTDPREEERSNLRSLFEVANCDREVLAEEYGEHHGSDMRAKILAVTSPPDEDDLTTVNDLSVALDQVKVVEAWRLPLCPGKPGRHVIAVGSLAVLDEPWEWDCFPFSFLVWGRDPERTIHGQGIVQRGLEVQRMLDHHCRVIDEAFERFVPKYVAPRSSNFDPTVLDRRVGQYYEYDGVMPPTVLSPGPISPDFLGYRQELANTWFAVTGISQMDARSEADDALESGKAKLIQGDINTGRFYPQGKRREGACVRLAELSIKMADLLCEEEEVRREAESEESEEREETSPLSDTGMSIVSAYDEEPEEDEDDGHPLDVPAGRDSWREKIPYSAARMSGKKDEAFAIDVWPVSSLSQSVAGRMEEVAQLEAAGHITDPQQARELLNIPILDDFQDLASARREAAEREIDRCLDGDQGIPSAYLDLDHALARATQEYCLAGIDEAPDDVMDALRSFIGATEMLIKNALPPAEPSMDPLAPAPSMPPEPVPPMSGPLPMDPMAAA
jgi:hypothetical protein